MFIIIEEKLINQYNDDLEMITEEEFYANDDIKFEEIQEYQGVSSEEEPEDLTIDLIIKKFQEFKDQWLGLE
jgi:hypothetical protein